MQATAFDYAKLLGHEQAIISPLKLNTSNHLGFSDSQESTNSGQRTTSGCRIEDEENVLNRELRYSCRPYSESKGKRKATLTFQPCQINEAIVECNGYSCRNRYPSARNCKEVPRKRLKGLVSKGGNKSISKISYSTVNSLGLLR